MVLKVKGSCRGAEPVGGTFAYGINDINRRKRERMREKNYYRPSTALAEVSMTQVEAEPPLGRARAAALGPLGWAPYPHP
jgi:hypothetical protein